MRVVLRPELFEEDEDTLLRLTTLLQHAVDGRHSVSPDGEAEARWRLWLAERPALEQRVYTTAIEKGQTREALSPSRRTIWVGGPQAPTLTHGGALLNLKDACTLLALPLSLRVEDAASDGRFLDRCVHPALRRAWEQAREDRLLQVDHLGGQNQVRPQLELVQGFVERRLRNVVILDSDMPRPFRSKDELMAQARSTWDARKAAKDLGVRVMVLRRRMAENYIPPSALEAWARSKENRPVRDQLLQTVQAFQALPRERQHHYHLKKGLGNEAAFYADLDETQRQALKKGLGRNTMAALDLATPEALTDYGVHSELAPLYRELLSRV